MTALSKGTEPYVQAVIKRGQPEKAVTFYSRYRATNLVATISSYDRGEWVLLKVGYVFAMLDG